MRICSFESAIRNQKSAIKMYASPEKYIPQIVSDRRPHFGVIGRKTEARRHDADDEVRVPLEHHRGADDARVAGE